MAASFLPILGHGCLASSLPCHGTRSSFFTGKTFGVTHLDAGLRTPISPNFALILKKGENCSVQALALAEGVEGKIGAGIEAASDGISNLRLESGMLKKRAKREELRRKRLVRKRHLRKKGRWPPAKMAKNKNV